MTEIGQARLACPNAVVIGVIPSKTRKPILNPPGDMRIKSGDALIYIAKHFADCAITDVCGAIIAPADARLASGPIGNRNSVDSWLEPKGTEGPC